jgi:hypothetical protein
MPSLSAAMMLALLSLASALSNYFHPLEIRGTAVTQQIPIPALAAVGMTGHFERLAPFANASNDQGKCLALMITSTRMEMLNKWL